MFVGVPSLLRRAAVSGIEIRKPLALNDEGVNVAIGIGPLPRTKILQRSCFGTWIVDLPGFVDTTGMELHKAMLMSVLVHKETCGVVVLVINRSRTDLRKLAFAVQV